RAVGREVGAQAHQAGARSDAAPDHVAAGRPLMPVSRGLWALLLLWATAAPARALEPRVLKLASVSPDGTLWSRELRAFAQEMDGASDGAVRFKLYLGAVAGDEMEVADRIKKGQLDAVASAGI